MNVIALWNIFKGYLIVIVGSGGNNILCYFSFYRFAACGFCNVYLQVLISISYSVTFTQCYIGRLLWMILTVRAEIIHLIRLYKSDIEPSVHCRNTVAVKLDFRRHVALLVDGVYSYIKVILSREIAAV